MNTTPGSSLSTRKRLTTDETSTRPHDGTGLDVYRLVAPLSERQLSRLPEWTQAAHDRLIVPHLERLSATPTQQSTVADVTAMLDRIQHSRPLAAHAPAHALQP